MEEKSGPEELQPSYQYSTTIAMFLHEKVQIRLNFSSNPKIFIDFEIPFETRSNGLYVLPVTALKQVINKFVNY